MQTSKKSIARILLAVMVILALAIPMTCTAFAAEAGEEAIITIGASAETAFSVDVDGEVTDYDLTDGDSALSYVESYADNLTNDPGF